jgi:hypothetical protein
MLISLLVAIVVVILLLYLVQLVPLDGRITLALQIAIILLAILYLVGFVR